ncbi:hypothetical protein GCM10009682_45440 [Luedemannella flava]|uniref:DUF4258 domain-containing protein n=1 Tax=Luedemannella flava TaxID=349316 RepID=A0ABN2MCJ2_9ACTN
MRYSWTSEALARARVLGVELAEVHQVLTSRRPVLRKLEDDNVLRIIGATGRGRVIEVWLHEDPGASDDDWEILVAFEAGLAGQALYRKVVGQEV